MCQHTYFHGDIGIQVFTWVKELLFTEVRPILCLRLNRSKYSADTRLIQKTVPTEKLFVFIDICCGMLYEKVIHSDKHVT